MLAYTPSLTRRRANIAQFAAKSQSADPQGAAAMRQLFARGDFIAALAPQIAPFGLRIDNVADAYTLYWINAWQAAHRDTGRPTRGMSQAVKAQAAAALSATPQFRAANDALKQEMAEAFIVQAMLISAMQDKYGSDPTMAGRLADAVRRGAKASGLDLDAMTLTEGGFVPAGRTGDATPAPGTPGASDAKGEALADATAPARSSPPYLLMAAAGGAGLGAAFLLGRSGRRG